MKEKNKYGQYFTEPVIADFMVTLIEHNNHCRVLEPSCGEGVFIKALKKASYCDVTAYEIDKELAREHNEVKYESFVTSPTSEKFDVVIGNPPYIRWKNLEPELRKELIDSPLWNKYFNSLCDYLFLFILKSVEQLNIGGELIFICSDYWLNTTHSLSLRNYLCENGYFKEIFLFKEAPLFENVCASFVIFKYIKSTIKPTTINVFTYNKRGKPLYKELVERSCFDNSRISQFEKGSRWIIAPDTIKESMLELEKACADNSTLFSDSYYKLGDFCDIGNGMVSGLDSAFKLSDNNIEYTDKERMCIIQVLKAKNLEQYSYSSSEQYIYMPEHISEDEFYCDYPNFASHLNSFRNKLDKRYNYGRYIPYWEFVFPRNKSLFERNVAKIFIPCKERISHKKYFRFCYSPVGFYPLQDVTGIVPSKTCKESVEYILSYLNNKRVFQWLCYNGIVKGEIVEFSEAPIASIPYPRIDWNNNYEVRLHNKITSETKAYILDNDSSHIELINNFFDELFYGKTQLQTVC